MPTNKAGTETCFVTFQHGNKFFRDAKDVYFKRKEIFDSLTFSSLQSNVSMVSNQTLNRRNGNYENVYLFESTDELDHAPRIIFIDDNSFTIKT